MRSTAPFHFEFLVTSNASDSILQNADALPTGMVLINNADSGTSVSIVNISTGRYSASGVFPSIGSNDFVQIAIAATVDTLNRRFYPLQGYINPASESLGTDGKVLLSTDPQTNVVIPQVARILSTTPLPGVAATEATIIQGTLVSGSVFDTAVPDGIYYVVSPTKGLKIVLSFNTEGIVQYLVVKGHFKGNDRYVQVYAWKFDSSTWEALSGGTLRSNTTDSVLVCSLLSRNRDFKTGKVKIMFYSSSTFVEDLLFLDEVRCY